MIQVGPCDGKTAGPSVPAGQCRQSRHGPKQNPRLEAPGAVWMAICNSGPGTSISVATGGLFILHGSWRTDWLEAFASWSTVVPD